MFMAVHETQLAADFGEFSHRRTAAATVVPWDSSKCSRDDKTGTLGPLPEDENVVGRERERWLLCSTVRLCEAVINPAACGHWRG